MEIRKLFGLVIVAGTILGAVVIVGPKLFNDIHSLLFVLGGAAGYGFIKSENGKWVRHIGNGGVYFGWLGTLIGLIAIAGNRFDVWGDVEKMGPALGVTMLTVFYGYVLKLVTMTLEKS